MTESREIGISTTIQTGTETQNSSCSSRFLMTRRTIRLKPNHPSPTSQTPKLQDSAHVRLYEGSFKNYETLIHSIPLWLKDLPIGWLGGVPGESDLYFSVTRNGFTPLIGGKLTGAQLSPILGIYGISPLIKNGKCHVPVANVTEFKEGVHVCVGFLFYQ